MMGINRSTVHLGLEELARMGLVRMEPRRGNFVADYTKDGDFNTLTAIAKYGDGDFDVSMRISLVELRNSIVGGALIRLAKIATSEDISQLRSMIEKHRRAEAQERILPPQQSTCSNLTQSLCGFRETPCIC